MTKEEFYNCKVGDKVLSSIGRLSIIEDINRVEGTLTIGYGKWRSYTMVRLPTIQVIRTERSQSPSDVIVIRKKLITKYGFPKALIMQTIEKAGQNGFVGSSEDLADCTEFVSREYTRNLLAIMCREKLINRQILAKGLYKYTLLERST